MSFFNILRAAWRALKNALKLRSVLTDEPAPSSPAIIENKLPNYVSDDDDSFRDRARKRRKSVVCAIDTWADGETLRGCDNDGANLTRRILERWDVPNSDIERILAHYWSKPDGLFMRVQWRDCELRVLRNNYATCARARQAMAWVTSGLADDGRAFWGQSSHGTQTPSDTEIDQLDECWVMYDHDWDNPMTWFIDDIIGDAQKNLKAGQGLKILSDSCHSDKMLRNAGPLAISRYLVPPADLVGARKAAHKAWFWGNAETESANAALLSGCTADSVSYTQGYAVNGKTVYEGALTHETLHIENAAPSLTLRQVHSAVYKILSSSRNKQEPQLEGADWLIDEPLFF
jgi:hypothetical protein